MAVREHCDEPRGDLETMVCFVQLANAVGSVAIQCLLSAPHDHCLSEPTSSNSIAYSPCFEKKNNTNRFIHLVEREINGARSCPIGQFLKRNHLIGRKSLVDIYDVNPHSNDVAPGAERWGS